MKLGDILLQYRQEHNLSMREFSKLCGLSPAQVYFMERGKNSHGDPFVPRLDSLDKVATTMGITLSELLSIMDDSMVVRIGRQDIQGSRQSVIDKIIIATPEQFALIQSYVDFVTK